mmetsp:Transcript_29627/g.70513  ORF Transcript_29627/g.70513 Transcript_29627/m.70513 type:complete len:230 (-) Transcript_29627:42-731(-)
MLARAGCDDSFSRSSGIGSCSSEGGVPAFNWMSCSSEKSWSPAGAPWMAFSPISSWEDETLGSLTASLRALLSSRLVGDIGPFSSCGKLEGDVSVAPFRGTPMMAPESSLLPAAGTFFGVIWLFFTGGTSRSVSGGGTSAGISIPAGSSSGATTAGSSLSSPTGCATGSGSALLGAWCITRRASAVADPDTPVRTASSGGFGLPKQAKHPGAIVHTPGSLTLTFQHLRG